MLRWTKMKEIVAEVGNKRRKWLQKMENNESNCCKRWPSSMEIVAKSGRNKRNLMQKVGNNEGN